MEIVLIALLIAWLTGGDKKKRARTAKAYHKLQGMSEKESKKRVAAYKRAHRNMIKVGREHGTDSDEWARAVRSQANAWNRLGRRDQRRYHKTK